MMLNVDITYNLLSQLSEQGIGIFVDDFGTGYAAVDNLKNFPVKSLKIARSFVADLASAPSDRKIANQSHSCNPRWLKSEHSRRNGNPSERGIVTSERLGNRAALYVEEADHC